MNRTKLFFVRATTTALTMSTLGLSFVGIAGAEHGGPIHPAQVDLVLNPGESKDVEKEVTTPTIPPKPDIYFLADTTGSMGAAIAGVQADAAAILAAIDAATTDAQYGAGDYKDFPFDAYAFKNAASIPGADDDGAAALGAIGAWAAGGGADGPEGQFYALDQIASGVVGWRPDSTKIVVWFGDAPAHDPVCSAISGLGYDIDEASLTAKLVGAGIKVIAISTPTGYPLSLDDDPVASSFNYGVCGAAGGAPGQATRIAAATGGLHLVAADPDDVADLIIEGLTGLKTDVWGVPACDPGLSVTLVPPVHSDVIGGSTVPFMETISVDGSVPEGSMLMCTVTFYANGYPKEGAVIGEQKITVKIPDRTAPEARCVPTTNPAGKNVPTAPAKGGQGMNQDGFYQLFGTDNVGVASIVVWDSVPSFTSDPFLSGDKIKLTQAPGVTPSDTRPGPSVITSHLKLKGDAYVVVTDTSGNTTRAACLVPPKPQ